jgi:hypothetical protein
VLSVIATTTNFLLMRPREAGHLSARRKTPS